MSLIDPSTGEIVQQCTPEAARELTDQIRLAVEGTWELIKRAYETRAWASLGYSSWDDYLTREFGTTRLRLPREERQEVVASLRESGLSTRAIEAATGISRPTIIKDLHESQVVNSLPPEPEGESEVVSEPAPRPTPRPVTGTDGKSYAARTRQPAAAGLHPLGRNVPPAEGTEEDQRIKEARDYRDQVERENEEQREWVESLGEDPDPEFTRRRQQASHTLSNLSRAIDRLEQVPPDEMADLVARHFAHMRDKHVEQIRRAASVLRTYEDALR